MTRPLRSCAFCALPTEGVRRIRDKRSGAWVWVCAKRKCLGNTAKLTARQRGIVTRSGMARAMGGG